MMSKKILAILLSLSMIGSAVSMPGFTDEIEAKTAEVTEIVEAEETVEASAPYTEDEIVSKETEEEIVYDDEGEFVSENIELASVSDISLMATSYYISTPADLANISNDLSGVYYLQNNIDLSGYTNWTPIGTGNDNGQYFNGVFDGQGHTISGLTMSGDGYTYSGLFGVSRGIIRNVNVSVSIKDAKTAGGLVGYLYGGATVENCSSSGSVAGTQDVGGLIGYAQSNGGGNTVLIRNCYSMASATSTSTTEADGCGGLIGEIYGYTYNSSINIISCYAAGKVTKTGTSGVGGIAGYTHTWDGSYTINSSYYCSSTTKQGDEQRGFSATTTQMKKQTTYANWDFDNIWEINSSVNNGYPYLKLTGEYNILKLSGTGAKADPYIITSEAELAAVARGEITNNFTAYYKLGNNITLTSDYWTPIGGNGMPYFSGSFDGAGYTIYNVNICVPAYENAGLFGIVTGSIKNVNITAKITDAKTAGGLVGYLYGGATVENCSSSGSVAGTQDIGGLIGIARSYNSGNTILIRNSYSMASATSTSTTEDDGCGGLVGEIYGYTNNSSVNIISCYAAGKVTKTGTSGVGGIAGYTHTWDGSYTINSSYYCSSTTKQGDEQRGFSATTTQMKKQATFANWDFDNIWEINSSVNNGYPYLKLTGEYNSFELDGSGTSRDPYIITSEAELAAVTRGEITNNFTAYYELGNNITLTSDYWTPIGGNGMPYFSGSFDGAGYTIYNVNIYVPAYKNEGLFGVVTGSVKNLNITARITDAKTAGGLVGYLYGGATVENCSSSGSVAGTQDVGGLIGYAQSNGGGNTVLIRNCYSMASATSTSTTEADGCGGLVGEIYGYTNNSSVNIISCYAAGKVTKTGTSGVGGIAGYTHTWDGSYTINSSYYCSDTTGQSDTKRGFSVNESEMKNQATYANWDFNNIWEINSSVNNGYPYLKLTGEYNSFELDGSGTSRDPYIITSEAELAAVARGEITNNFTAYYELGNDITLTSDYWTPIGGNGMPYFSGSFDGAGYTIYNVNICVPAYEYEGLFGVVTGQISNLGLKTYIVGGNNVGGLVGTLYQKGKIEKCYTEGVVSGKNDVGGLVGFAESNGSGNEVSISNSYSKATVTSTSLSTNDGCGGLVGEAYGYTNNSTVKIENCYATQKVTKSGSDGIGGLVGYSHTWDGAVTVLSSYFDNYNDSSTSKGTNVSTENMKLQSNYSGWDFDSTWAISSNINDGYPYLQVLVPKATLSVTGVQLNKTATSLSVGGTEALTATVTPSNATNKNVTWTSSNTSVAIVSNGKITAKSAGTATITARTSDGNYTATCVVTVTGSSQPDNPNPPVTDGVVVKVSSVTASAGNTVNVTVDLSGNTGFANLGIQVGYDANNLTLTSVTNNASVGATYTGAQSITANPYNMGWDSTSNVTYNGNLATLTFRVKENATEGKYPITISYYKGISGNYTDGEDVNYDANFNSLGLSYMNGAITVSSHIAGDINGDGKVNNQDGTFLLRHLAGWNVNVDESALDVNGDGRLNNQDGTVLLRYLAGWSVTIH